jgi:hypothetical protein
MPLLDELRASGYTVTLSGEGKIKLRGSCRPSPELEKRIRECRDELRAALDAELVASEADVFALARKRFDTTPFDPDDHPLPPAQRGRDPLVQRNTGKAIFYRRGEGWRRLPPQLPPPPPPPTCRPMLYADGEERPAVVGTWS